MNYFKLYEDLEEMVKDEVFHVTFIKKDKSKRVMTCNLTKAAENLVNGFLPVYDQVNEGHRFVNLNTLIELRIEEKVYEIKEDQWILKK
jgi:hypothetical protein